MTPAAIISEANVWRHSCSVIRASFADVHALGEERFRLIAPDGERDERFEPARRLAHKLAGVDRL